MSRINIITEGYDIDPTILPYSAVFVDTGFKTIQPFDSSLLIMPSGFYEDDDWLIIFDEEDDSTIDGKLVLDVRFDASEKGSFSSNMTINSDDPDTPAYNVELLGTSIEEILSFTEKEDIRTETHVYGVKIEQIISSANPESFIVSQVKREIREAIQKHPELKDVINLTIEQDGSDVNIKFSVVKQDGTQINLEEVLK